MTAQGSLFDGPAVRVADPVTSVCAARSVDPGRTERLILDTFAAAGRVGLTDDELVAVLVPLYPPTVKTARSRLSKRAHLVDSGRRRLSNRGRDQIVWVFAFTS